MLIQLPDDILTLGAVQQFGTSANGIKDVTSPMVSDAEGMPAITSILSLFTDFQTVLSDYAGLVTYDSERMIKIVNAFKHSDQ